MILLRFFPILILSLRILIVDRLGVFSQVALDILRLVHLSVDVFVDLLTANIFSL